MRVLFWLFYVGAIGVSFGLLLLGGGLSPRTDAPIFGFNLTYDSVEVPAWHAALTFVCVLAGTLCGLIIEKILSEKTEGHRQPLWTLIQYASTPTAVFLSSVVFLFAFPALYRESGDAATYLSAFQTAFLFRQFLSGMLAGRTAQTAN